VYKLTKEILLPVSNACVSTKGVVTVTSRYTKTQRCSLSIVI
jgi:hypothetical protein